MSVARPKNARVIGLGNVLLGDDGLGPLVIERLRAEYECGPDVDIVDLGTPGFDLTQYLSDASLVVCVDAVLAEDEPGSLHIYTEADLPNRSAFASIERGRSRNPGISGAVKIIGTGTVRVLFGWPRAASLPVGPRS